MPKTAAAIIHDLDLAPHPEGGWYRELHRSSVRVTGPHGSRAALTTIYYLLERNQSSRWHVVDADEIWHFYDGAPLELITYDPRARRLERTVLSSLNSHGELTTNVPISVAPIEVVPIAAVPVGVVPAGTWQAARSLGDYSLTGCSVGPGFDFADFRFVSALPEHAEHFIQPLDPWRDLL